MGENEEGEMKVSPSSLSPVSPLAESVGADQFKAAMKVRRTQEVEQTHNRQ